MKTIRLNICFEPKKIITSRKDLFWLNWKRYFQKFRVLSEPPYCLIFQLNNKSVMVTSCELNKERSGNSEILFLPARKKKICLLKNEG